MDNETNASPMIPAGTEPTVFGSASFNGQGAGSPDNGKPESVPSPEAQSVSEEAPNGITFDEVAAKKGFKSADDLAKAYANLESQKTRVEMSLAELIKLREDSQQLADTDAQPAQVENQDDAMKVVERIVKKVTRPLEDKLALQDLLLKNPDVKNYAAQIANAIKENPGISWESAYKLAKFDAIQTQSVSQGKQEAYQAIQQKQAVNVAAARPKVANQKPLQDLIKDKAIPFNEIQRIMRERFSQ